MHEWYMKFQSRSTNNENYSEYSKDKWWPLRASTECLNTTFVTKIEYIGSVLISGVYTRKDKLIKICELYILNRFICYIIM